jgi:prepilin signal peptidase PulO-like enzyme (type II secretory pathway)
MTVYFIVYACLNGKLGLADVWYAGFAGAVFGPVWWFLVCILACVLALVFMLALRIRSVVFIPFMAAGGFIALPFFFRHTSVILL